MPCRQIRLRLDVGALGKVPRPAEESANFRNPAGNAPPTGGVIRHLENTMEILRDPVIFLPVRNGRVPQILDFATLSSSGVYVGNYLGQTVDQVRADYPDAQLGECDDQCCFACHGAG